MDGIGPANTHLHCEDLVVDTIVADARPKNLLARAVGILTAPRATYAEVAERPRALGILLLVILVCASAIGVFLSTETGRDAMLQQQIQTLESFGVHPSDAQYARMKEANARPPILTMVGQAVFFLVAAAVVAGIALAVFNLMGGDGTFRQTFAVVAHSGVVLALQALFVTPLNYARESMSSATNLAVFFPFLDDSSFAARLLGAVDLFIVWWIVSLSIGLAVLFKRRTAPVAATLLAVYVFIGAVIAVVKTALSGA